MNSYVYTPTKSFTFWQKCNPLFWFQNADEPTPPSDYTGNQLQWLLRNFAHNFTFYVIGIADKPFTRYGDFPDKVFNPQGGWNHCWILIHGKDETLPAHKFISYCSKPEGNGGFRWYWGFREKGNWGIALKFK